VTSTRRGGRRSREQRGEPQILRRAKWIERPGDKADRNGQTLATRSEQVIKSWAEARGGKPATTTREGPPRVLRLDFPGYGGEGLRKIDWKDWLGTFKDRRLTFVFQERLRNGNQSNFFRLTNPNRGDG
jgi:hypothetical protein